MKVIILSLLSCALTGSAGYWITGDPVSVPASKRTSAEAKRTVRRSRATFSLITLPVPAAETAAATVAPTASGDDSTARPETAVAMPSVQAGPATLPVATSGGGPIEGVEIVSVDDDIRYVPATRPALPVAQHPPEATPENTDTGKPVHEWQRLTDDWWGARPWLDDHGISINANITMDGSSVFSGGVDGSGSAFRELFNLNATIDTERLFDWKGGTFFVNFQNQAGSNGGEDVGDLQGVSNIDTGGDRTQVSELWYEQAVLDGRVRVKVGKIDANVDFDHVADADSFINGAFGAAPTILGFPTYPDPAMGVTAFVKPTEKTYVGVGAFDGSGLNGHPTGNIGPAGFFDGDSYFFIAEGGVDWTIGNGLDGRFGAGVWHHTGDFEQFDGGISSGATGPYVIFDQKVWREDPDNQDDEQGLGVFVKYGYADPDVSPIENQVAAGLAWTGLIPTRDDDTLGFGISWAGLSGQAGFAHDSETVYELFYRARLNTWFSVQPDLQYIANPADGGTADAIVGTLRIMIDF